MNSCTDRLASDAVNVVKLIIAGHPVSPDSRDFEIISVEEMVTERTNKEIEHNQRRDLIQGSVSSWEVAALNISL